ncbi:MAG: bifunctional UDP-3-O-[3-hydroxymyristoyl] N-acetylglucosamine deacetylase/3-hydroxyacyl-ACP dehydratase [Candidatus Cardinium sp.]|uniref:bifunctional UDP-3-O-[3-hydroxymyristoyl] N-acetylglucosamine deacetylase/3-hydroxyacyl-ACP dehydratase n=1 Tax=Cardinium endosymbiont of Dermatophagoides farinae TaxID=2597823 RepID=UPI001181FC12|nr:bifunctional UDP-3-O-[3-hydroxymyristoyl] N-acetylglucosamine deacetylase/3-hydroxyacyl-ACP dehydratase [Cardinium endosymbiont of Dermatophagoides farinae]TSJ80998.1 bifunctional UDP-3-O-[3-hydroxymyristoyl] N-acetylglucosamine deacetylase/3-hydroxyacyl-ACP dehydratase [Cardinium endosymbiont of Dermatophagoides farinae]UWW97024.1 MAG: bifunctional UDP-3-O-[3-hydroxymyristoyl] N-acetylglucosamine deacetylase/3-hydroxyacyl-ACP dehydratase [Candidatus Cardinium sp.]
MTQRQQQTIQRIISFEGIGLHTGSRVKGRLLPMPIDTGIQFQRVDLPGQPCIEASVTHVVATERGTVVEKDQARVATVEHLLAAIVGMQVDNISIQLDGAEVPDIDGSALAFVALLLEAGLLQQEAPQKFFKLKEKFSYDDPDTGSHYAVYPDTDYNLHLTIVYNRWPVGYQYASLSKLADFKEAIAPARTFIYLDEIAALYEKGLLQGGDPTKAVIFSDHTNHTEWLQQVTQLSGKQVENLVTPAPSSLSSLRYINEPARHKLLDLIGDMALLGRPLQAKLVAHMPGHGANIGFVAALRKHLLRQEQKGAPICNLHATPLFDVKQISKMLPHRYPFQLVDKIMELGDSYVIGVKNVTINEPFFQGHFPGTPVMPGVLQVEALAQAGGILCLHKVPDPEQYLTYFLSIDGCKFRRMVVPGDTLLLHCELLAAIKFSTTEKQSVGIAKVKGRIFVGEQLACEAVLLAQIVKQYETI